MRTASVKGNQAKKTLSFFRVNFGFEPPYQVICDGSLIAASLKNDLYLKQSLPKLLGSPSYIVVTECIVRALREAGQSFSNAAIFAKRATRVPCAHDGKATEEECIASRLRKPFSSKLLLASSNQELISTLGNIPGIPLITVANSTKLVLRPPSKETLLLVKRKGTEKSNVLTAADKALLEKVKAEKKAARASRMPAKVEKKKKAKGPNPLSMKRSKTGPKKEGDDQRAESNESKEGGHLSEKADLGGSASEEVKSKRRRKRKRKKSENENEDLSSSTMNVRDEMNSVEDHQAKPPVTKKRRVSNVKDGSQPKQSSPRPATEPKISGASQLSPSTSYQKAPRETVQQTALREGDRSGTGLSKVVKEKSDLVPMGDQRSSERKRNEATNMTALPNSEDGPKPKIVRVRVASGVNSETLVDDRCSPPSGLNSTATDRESSQADNGQGDTNALKSGDNEHAFEQSSLTDGAETPVKKKQRKNRRRRPKKASTE